MDNQTASATTEVKKVAKNVAKNADPKAKQRERIAEHILGVSDILMYNAFIRRATALGIINFLTQKGIIKENPEGKKVSKYVDFRADKFAIIVNGLKSEFRYNEEFFLKAFAASFISFSANGQKAIDILVAAEHGCKADDIIDASELKEVADAITERAERKSDD